MHMSGAKVTQTVHSVVCPCVLPDIKVVIWQITMHTPGATVLTFVHRGAKMCTFNIEHGVRVCLGSARVLDVGIPKAKLLLWGPTRGPNTNGFALHLNIGPLQEQSVRQNINIYFINSLGSGE